MKTLNFIVSINEIPAAGLSLQGELEPDWIGDSLLDAYTALSPLKVDLLVKRIGDNVHVDGELHVRLGFSCSRTLAPGQLDLHVTLGELFQPAHAHKMNLGSGVDSEDLEGDQPYLYDGPTIDIEPFVREQLVLAQEPYPRIEQTDAAEPLTWNDAADDGDPRWAKLRDVKLGA